MPKHTLKTAHRLLYFIHKNVSTEASIIGSVGRGKESENDIDILIPNLESTKELSDKLFYLLRAEKVEDTDWDGLYFTNTKFGNVDIFFSTEGFTYGL